MVGPAHGHTHTNVNPLCDRCDPGFVTTHIRPTVLSMFLDLVPHQPLVKVPDQLSSRNSPQPILPRSILCLLGGGRWYVGCGGRSGRRPSFRPITITVAVRRFSFKPRACGRADPGPASTRGRVRTLGFHPDIPWSSWFVPTRRFRSIEDHLIPLFVFYRRRMVLEHDLFPFTLTTPTPTGTPNPTFPTTQPFLLSPPHTDLDDPRGKPAYPIRLERLE
jgi:hypothetical protein